MWIKEAALANTRPPLALDVSSDPWPQQQFDAVFSANCVHIMHWPDVEAMFAGIGRVLAQDGILALYGPFNYHGAYTSDSNARFDQWLRQRDPASGVRDFAELQRLAQRAGMAFREDYAMPANNRILCWVRK
jgi:SAM-dependent methyltransferase